MTVAELRALLDRLPDDLPVFIQSALGHGECHVTGVRRRRRGTASPGLHLAGDVSSMHAPPAVEVRGGASVRRETPPVDVDRARDELLRMLTN